MELVKGQRVYRAYVTEMSLGYWIDEGVVSSEVDGQQFVRTGSLMVLLDDKWHATKALAKDDVIKAFIRKAGEFQARIDELREEIAVELITAN
jgi:hypothetical protein